MFGPQELQKLAEPLHKYLLEHGNPYDVITVTFDQVTVQSTTVACPLSEGKVEA